MDVLSRSFKPKGGELLTKFLGELGHAAKVQSPRRPSKPAGPPHIKDKTRSIFEICKSARSNCIATTPSGMQLGGQVRNQESPPVSPLCVCMRGGLCKVRMAD